MKVTVVGATGLIGRKVVKSLTDAGHQTTAAARALGVDVLTGEGLADALTRADALVDVTNAPTFDSDGVMEFFTTSTANLVAAASEARVKHYVVLSIVGADGLSGSGYVRGKIAQERVVAESGLPYTIVRATQFHEFTATTTSRLTKNGQVRVPDALIQPVAADEVAVRLSLAAVSKPVNGIVNVGGLDKLSFADMAGRLSHRAAKTSRLSSTRQRRISMLRCRIRVRLPLAAPSWAAHASPTGSWPANPTAIEE